MRSSSKVLLNTIFLLMLGSGLSTTVYAAPEAELWPYWQGNDPQSSLRVDHSSWANFLNKYLLVGNPGTVTLVRYASVTTEDKKTLANY